MAAWQKKTKPLTEEEAVALARSQLAPLWDGSVPRLAPIKQANGTVTVHPLDHEFVRGAWILYFLDPLTYDGQAFVRLAREWGKRYGGKALNSIVVLRASWPFQSAPGYLEGIRKQLGLTFPLVLDAEGLLAKAFHAKNPRSWVLLLDGGKPIASFDGHQALGEGESTVQKFLRSHDPGLPLAPLMEQIEGGLKDLACIDFNDPSVFPTPGFAPVPGQTPESPPVLAASFGAPPMHSENGSLYPVQGFRIFGHWVRDGARIMTSDPQARISFYCSGSHMSLIAESLARPGSHAAEIAIELNGKAVFDAASGPELEITEGGRTAIFPEAGLPRIFNVLAALPEKYRKVDLLFPGAAQAPVALYGIRMGDAL